MVVMCAFKAYSLKDISRSQMASADRFFMSDQKKLSLRLKVSINKTTS